MINRYIPVNPIILKHQTVWFVVLIISRWYYKTYRTVHILALIACLSLRDQILSLFSHCSILACL